MLRFCLNSLICSLLVLIFPVIVPARSNKDADAVISMRNGRPCFSYQQDAVIQKRQYKICFLSVIKISDAREGWLTSVNYDDKKAVIEPNTLEACIKYGIPIPGMKEVEAADPLLSDTPYRVFMQVSAVPGYERKFASEFCVTRNEKGETVIVEATGGGRGEWRCLKPGESKKSGFWGWLFGK